MTAAAEGVVAIGIFGMVGLLERPQGVILG
jgi:hypothetical protein